MINSDQIVVKDVKETPVRSGVWGEADKTGDYPVHAIDASLPIHHRVLVSPFRQASPAELEYAREEVRHRFWHMLYGDLDKEFCELVNWVELNLGFGAGMIDFSKFNELVTAYRNKLKYHKPEPLKPHLPICHPVKAQ